MSGAGSASGTDRPGGSSPGGSGSVGESVGGGSPPAPRAPRMVAIVNPKSRLGATARRVAEVERLLARRFGPDLAVRETERAGDGERLGREAREGGATSVIAAGGDGTFSEVVTGLLGDRASTDVELGLLPLGTGGDFARALGLDADLARAVDRLAAGERRRVDVGRVVARDPAAGPGASERARLFLNIASFGLTGESARWLHEQAARGRRSRFSYLWSAPVGLARYPSPRVTLTLDGGRVHDGPVTYVAVANGSTFAGGLRVAPAARIDDGLLEVVVVPGMSIPGALAHYARLLAGRPAASVSGRGLRGRRLEAESEGTVWIEADGELVGVLPARFEVLQAALPLFGLPPARPGE